jgi:hypothetical protein
MGCVRVFVVSRSKANWSRALPAPIDVGKRKLRTLRDVRAHVLKLPAVKREMPGWHSCAGALIEAAEGDSMDRVSFTFRFARLIHRD